MKENNALETAIFTVAVNMGVGVNLHQPQRSVEVLRDFVTPLVAINPGRLAVLSLGAE